MIILETKQYHGYGIKLNKENKNTLLAPQMSEEWIDNILKKEGFSAETKKIIDKAKMDGKLTKYVGAINRKSEQLLLLKMH